MAKRPGKWTTKKMVILISPKVLEAVKLATLTFQSPANAGLGGRRRRRNDQQS